jgi:ring-1,2-phenylacetyl-CoA epoxidase subunit PaaB
MRPHGNPEMPASAGKDEDAAPAAAPAAATPAQEAAARPASTDARADAAIHGRPNVWPLWEVFVRSSRGLSHVHAGSLHAPDAEMALRNARDLYTRRNEGVSIWVVPADAIAASDPDAKGAFFESPQGKDYRHATYYTKSEGVKHL